MEHIPIVRLGEFLLVSIQVDVHDRLALKLHEDLGTAILRHKARGVLIEVSSLDTLDTFIGQVLAEISATARLLGAETVLCGMRPAVALTLVELGVHLDTVKTALDVDKGSIWLQKRMAEIDDPDPKET